jgi:hypothetical protein
MGRFEPRTWRATRLGFSPSSANETLRALFATVDLLGPATSYSGSEHEQPRTDVDAYRRGPCWLSVEIFRSRSPKPAARSTDLDEKEQPCGSVMVFEA